MGVGLKKHGQGIALDPCESITAFNGQSNNLLCWERPERKIYAYVHAHSDYDQSSVSSAVTNVLDGRLHLVEDLLAAGHTLAQLRAWERAEQVVECVRGAWISWESWLAIGNGLDQAAACLRHPGAIVCHYSAALWHLLSDEDPRHIWTSAIAVPGIVWTDLDRTVGVDTYDIAGVTVRVTSAPGQSSTCCGIARNSGRSQPGRP